MGRIRMGLWSADRTLTDLGRFTPKRVMAELGAPGKQSRGALLAADASLGGNSSTPLSANFRHYAERLHFYASHFPITEVINTNYGLPSDRIIGVWIENTPSDFRFHVRAYGMFAHYPAKPNSIPDDLRETLAPNLREMSGLFLDDITPELREELWRRFRQALLPLRKAKKLGMVLFQFAPWFPPSPESQQYILECQKRLSPMRMAVEFRDASWLTSDHYDETMDFLRKNKLAFICVDEPQGHSTSIPPVAEATCDQAYVRFRGRNRETWEGSNIAGWQIFNYSYSDQELSEWVPKIRALEKKARQVHLVFNTNFQDQGVANAQRLARLLGEPALSAPEWAG